MFNFLYRVHFVEVHAAAVELYRHIYNESVHEYPRVHLHYARREVRSTVRYGKPADGFRNERDSRAYGVSFPRPDELSHERGVVHEAVVGENFSQHEPLVGDYGKRAERPENYAQDIARAARDHAEAGQKRLRQSARRKKYHPELRPAVLREAAVAETGIEFVYAAQHEKRPHYAGDVIQLPADIKAHRAQHETYIKKVHRITA